MLTSAAFHHKHEATRAFTGKGFGYRFRDFVTPGTRMPFTEAQLSYLDQYGFDELLLDNWRKGVREGWYSRENNWVQSEIHGPETETIESFPKRETERRDELQAIGLESLRRGELGIVILNGGMATRFGGAVKGTVPVLGSRSFLQLRMEDVRRAQGDTDDIQIPIYLMNSFATDGKTRDHCVENGNFGLPEGQIRHFTQFISVRMKKNGDLFQTASGELSYYGPGHGDFAPAIRKSGCLEEFLAGGGKYLFVSNVDNLGARISPVMLGLHVLSQKEMTIELAPKWPGDVGGSPYLVDGRVQLVEQIRYPDGFDPDIVDVFNTNTFTFTAEALRRDMDMGWYYVEKSVDDKPAVQMERLIGETTRTLDSHFVRVKRTGTENRFLPVKTPEDLESAREEIEQLYP
jgi:UTP--glucose-1-phosphate uridylyltransferase